MVDFTTSYEDNFARSEGIDYLGTTKQINTKLYKEEALETLTTKDFVETLRDYYQWRDGESTLYTGAGDLKNDYVDTKPLLQTISRLCLSNQK